MIAMDSFTDFGDSTELLASAHEFDKRVDSIFSDLRVQHRMLESVALPNVPETNEDDESINDDRLKTRVAWQEVRDRLDELRIQGEPYTSQGKLAKQLKVSRSTINKAISNSAPLKLWMRQANASKGSPRAERMTDKTLGNAAQTTEPGPHETLTHEEELHLIAELLDKASPKERADLNAKSTAELAALAMQYRDHLGDSEPSPLNDNPPKELSKPVHHKTV